MSAHYVGFHAINVILSGFRAPSMPGTFNRESDRFYFWHVADRRTENLSITQEEALTYLGRILLEENARSLRSRYGSDIADMLGGEAPGDYVFEPTTTDRLTPEVLLNGLKGYEYQACESDDYRATQAAFIVNAMREALVRRIASVAKAGGFGIEDFATPLPKRRPHAAVIATVTKRTRRTVRTVRA